MTDFDPERLLAALPTLQLRQPVPNAPRRFLQWRWPMVQPYMGFTPVERVRNWQIGRWLIAAGCMTVPHGCSICGRAEKVGLHSENYYDVTRSPVVCSRCHMTLHRRFFQPAAWVDVAGRNMKTGREWFALISSRPFDLAQYLRQKRGDQIAQMLRSPALMACIGISERLPTNLHGTPDRQVRLEQPDLFNE